MISTLGTEQRFFLTRPGDIFANATSYALLMADALAIIHRESE